MLPWGGAYAVLAEIVDDAASMADDPWHNGPIRLCPLFDLRFQAKLEHSD